MKTIIANPRPAKKRASKQGELFAGAGAPTRRKPTHATVKGWVLTAVSSGEQTEASVFHDAQMKGATKAQVEAAVSELVDARAIRSTVIADRGAMTHEKDHGRVRHHPALVRVGGARLKNPRKGRNPAARTRAATVTEGGSTMAKPKKKKARTAAQKAATARMLAANKRGGAPKKRTRKAGKRKARKAPARRSSSSGGFRYAAPRRKKARRRNPSIPKVAKVVGATLAGAAVGAAGVVGIGMLMDKYPMSRNQQLAALTIGGVVAGAVSSAFSPFAGAAAAMPMFAAAASVLTSTMTASPPVQGILTPRQLAATRTGVSGVPAFPPGVSGIFDPRTGRPDTSPSRADLIRGVTQQYARSAR